MMERDFRSELLSNPLILPQISSLTSLKTLFLKMTMSHLISFGCNHAMDSHHNTLYSILNSLFITITLEEMTLILLLMMTISIIFISFCLNRAIFSSNGILCVPRPHHLISFLLRCCELYTSFGESPSFSLLLLITSDSTHAGRS